MTTPTAETAVEDVQVQSKDFPVAVKATVPETKVRKDTIAPAFARNGYGDHNGEEALPELRTGHCEPLELSGILDRFGQFDVTPVIGREFVSVDLAEWLKAPNADELLRDLAITSTIPV
jgi:hypothetical protein